MFDADIDQIGDIGFAYAHHGVGAAPINSYRAVGFGYSTASEDNVVNITSDFPRVFRLKNPRIADADDLGWVIDRKSTRLNSSH